MFGRATIRLGIGPHSSFSVFFVLWYFSFIWFILFFIVVYF